MGREGWPVYVAVRVSVVLCVIDPWTAVMIRHRFPMAALRLALMVRVEDAELPGVSAMEFGVRFVQMLSWYRRRGQYAAAEAFEDGKS